MDYGIAYIFLSCRVYLYILDKFFSCRIYTFKSYGYFFYRLFIILQSLSTFVMAVQIQGSCLKYLIMSRYISFYLFSLLYIYGCQFYARIWSFSMLMNKGMSIRHIVQYLTNWVLYRKLIYYTVMLTSFHSRFPYIMWYFLFIIDGNIKLTMKLRFCMYFHEQGKIRYWET